MFVQNNRYWVISRCPSLRILDFAKIKDSERSKATELFGKRKDPTELAQQVSHRTPQLPFLIQQLTNARQILSVRSAKSLTSTSLSSQTNGTTSGKAYNVKMTEEETKRFQELIKNAKTLAEVARLEKAYQEGRIPAGMMDE